MTFARNANMGAVPAMAIPAGLEPATLCLEGSDAAL
jgi:hypothetical protein